MTTDLKTLKDMDGCGFIRPPDTESFCFYEYENESHHWCDACRLTFKLRQEAIKWVKHYESDSNTEIQNIDTSTTPYTIHFTKLLGCREGGMSVLAFIVNFFNLTEEDLK